MIIRTTILLLILGTIASAQSLIFESYPGCWTGPRRSTISASVDSVPIMFYYNDDGSKALPVNVGTAKQSKATIDRLLALELSKEEIKMLEDHDSMIGPAHYELKLTLSDRIWKVSYPDFLVNLTSEKKKLMKYDEAFLAVIEKIEKIHKIMSESIPEDAKR
jgi:hypothetical protein